MIKNYTLIFSMLFPVFLNAQPYVKVVKSPGKLVVDISINGKPFTSFLYPDTLEKPLLFPIRCSNGTIVTRGFPLQPRPGEPTDHPHHVGMWLNFESVNGLDFWNNSYNIPTDKKHLYGWIKTDSILKISSGKTGSITYHANWVNQANHVILEEVTKFEFKAVGINYIIDRTTTLKAADSTVFFEDRKDGLLGLRVAHELQIPDDKETTLTDDKGNITKVAADNKIPTGSYFNSNGLRGNNVWSKRASWCKMFGKMGNDSVSIVIIDHPKNINYPSWYHARGYGLFAVNPLGEKVFTEGKSATNMRLKKGEAVTFRYRVVVSNGKRSISEGEIGRLEKGFGAY